MLEHSGFVLHYIVLLNQKNPVWILVDLLNKLNFRLTLSIKTISVTQARLRCNDQTIISPTFISLIGIFERDK